MRRLKRQFSPTLLFGIGITALIIFFSEMHLHSQQQKDKEYAGSIESVEQIYDGDTIENVFVKIADDKTPTGKVWPGIYKMEDGIYAEFALRLNGIDTPEMRPAHKNRDGTLRPEKDRQKERAAAHTARHALIELLQTHEMVFYVRNPKVGKYAGRLVADLLVGEERINASTFLIKKGHAQFYDGGTKPVWSFDSSKRIMNKLTPLKPLPPDAFQRLDPRQSSDDTGNPIIEGTTDFSGNPITMPDSIIGLIPLILSLIHI